MWAVTTTVKATKCCVMDSSVYCAHDTLPSLTNPPVLRYDINSPLLPSSSWITRASSRPMSKQKQKYRKCPFLRKWIISVTEAKERAISRLPVHSTTPPMECRHCCARLLADSLKLSSQRMPKTWSQRQEALWGLLAPLDTMR